jgi:hypothetical protein
LTLLGASGNVTNYYNTTITTNLQVILSAIISNINFITGNGNRVTITNTLNVSGGFVYPLQAGTGITITTNTVGTGQTNVTIAASASGTTVSVNGTNVTTPNLQDTATVTLAVSGSNITANAASTTPAFNTLSYSGTNVTLDASLGSTEAAYYKLVLTNNAWFTTPSSVPATPKGYQIWVQQPSTGTCLVQWTNVSFVFPGGVQPVVDTNNNAVSVVTFAKGPFTNSVLSYIGIAPQLQ